VASGARVRSACAEAGIDVSTYGRWHKGKTVTEDGRAVATRPAPANKLSVQEREAILLTCHLPEFKSLPPSQIVPTLADRGMYIGSESSFYRVLRAANEVHDRGRAKPRHGRSKPTECVTKEANQCWCWDVTWLKSPVRGQFYYLYMIEDVFSRKIVSWEVHETESGDLASTLVKKGVQKEGYPTALQVLHADNGAIQKSSTLRVTLERLGIEPSYSRPRVSNDNAYPESLFRTVKYRPDYPLEGFASLNNAREWVQQFVTWYNEEHRHSGIKFVTPSQRHSGEDIKILEKRKTLYEEAKSRAPSRWSGNTRDWTRESVVILNPDQREKSGNDKLEVA